MSDILFTILFHPIYFLLLIKSLTEAGRPPAPWQTMPLYQEAQELVVWRADRANHTHKTSSSFSEGEILRRIFDYGSRWLYSIAQYNVERALYLSLSMSWCLTTAYTGPRCHAHSTVNPGSQGRHLLQPLVCASGSCVCFLLMKADKRGSPAPTFL